MFKCTRRNVSVQVQVWKCQCVSVEVSVFKRFSGRTLREKERRKEQKEEGKIGVVTCTSVNKGAEGTANYGVKNMNSHLISL